MSDQSDNETNVALSRLYKEAANAQPPSALDRAILSAAAAALAQPPARKSAWWHSWRGPVTALATIVLTVSLTVMVRYEQARDEGAVASAQTRVEHGVADQAAEKSASPAPMPRATMRQAPPSLASPSVFESKKEVAAEPAPRGDVLPTDNVPASLSAPQSASQMGAKSNMLRRLPEVQPAPGPAASPESLAPNRGETEAGRMRSNEEARDVMLAPSPEAAPGITAVPTVEVWLARIRDIKKQGKEQEAKAALAEFKRAYPDFRLPPDMQ